MLQPHPHLAKSILEYTMPRSTPLISLAVGSLLILTGAPAMADGRDDDHDSHDRVRFADFTPLAVSASPTLDEAMPITFGNAAFLQRSLADRVTALSLDSPNTGNWDMNTVNENGKQRGRFLFTVFETGQAGIMRIDLRTEGAETIWISPAVGGHVAFDASYWTPWGTFITAEESWNTYAVAPAPGAASNFGRVFELRNPLTAPGIVNPVGLNSNAGATLVHQNVIPRTSHEGIQFDRAGNMYFIDELNGGALYKYTPKADFSAVKNRNADYFAAGQTFVLRVGDGLTPNATGAYTWVPITDINGAALPGARVITDRNGVTSVDGRNTTDLPAFKGTDYQRPEDLQIQRVRGNEYMYVATTTTNEVYRLDLAGNTISVFANRATLDLATGAPVGTGLTSPDNLAIDHEGNVYIVEDRGGGIDNDIWFAKDLNLDGDLLDAGEGLGRWASNGTLGSEFTGLYFDPRDKRRAWVNIQHPDSDNDRTIEISIAHDDDDSDDSDDGHDD
jgi:secreted PhoX family phosphatase